MNQIIRFLQQENSRLQLENEHLQNDLIMLEDLLQALPRLNEAADQLVSEKELETLLDKILYYALTTLDAADGSVSLLDKETDELVFLLVRGNIEQGLVNFRMPRTEGITGWVVENGRPALVNNVKQDLRFSAKVDQLFAFDTISMLCAPLKQGQHTIGAISVINKHSGRDFNVVDQSLLSLLGRIAAIALGKFQEDSNHTPDSQSG
ncbi:MAG: GAF domain-containing protein [Anaerolineales bacterium]|nr:GAF domain-containing protein [Anaerolineales bacterium]